MNRVVQPELLDLLPAGDPRAVKSRRDLLRLNSFMGHVRIVSRLLAPLLEPRAPLRIVEVGASEGLFLLEVARRHGRRTPASPVDLTLVDRQPVTAPEAERQFSDLHWRVRVRTIDVFEFLDREKETADVMLANLFLHHFQDDRLKNLLQRAASRARCFIALEPRRTSWAMMCSRWVGLLGCNAVTRHDARASVEAGFVGNELSRLWPRGRSWELKEQSASWFSHLFVARAAGSSR